jgi:hypothetical protein
MSLRSLYYHVHEARRRVSGGADDFSSWLEKIGADAGLVNRLRSIDFYFLNLGQLRQEILTIFKDYLSDLSGLAKVNP